MPGNVGGVTRYLQLVRMRAQGWHRQHSRDGPERERDIHRNGQGSFWNELEGALTLPVAVFGRRDPAGVGQSGKPDSRSGSSQRGLPLSEAVCSQVNASCIHVTQPFLSVVTLQTTAHSLVRNAT